MTSADAHELDEMYRASAKEVSSSAAPVNWSDPSLHDVDKVAEHDKYDMVRMGKKQEMRRVFRQFSILSFTCVIMATWEFLLTANT